MSKWMSLVVLSVVCTFGFQSDLYAAKKSKKRAKSKTSAVLNYDQIMKLNKKQRAMYMMELRSILAEAERLQNTGRSAMSESEKILLEQIRSFFFEVAEAQQVDPRTIPGAHPAPPPRGGAVPGNTPPPQGSLPTAGPNTRGTPPSSRGGFENPNGNRGRNTSTRGSTQDPNRRAPPVPTQGSTQDPNKGAPNVPTQGPTQGGNVKAPNVPTGSTQSNRPTQGPVVPSTPIPQKPVQTIPGNHVQGGNVGYPVVISAPLPSYFNPGDICVIGGNIGTINRDSNINYCTAKGIARNNCSQNQVPCNELLFGRKSNGDHFCASAKSNLSFPFNEAYNDCKQMGLNEEQMEEWLANRVKDLGFKDKWNNFASDVNIYCPPGRQTTLARQTKICEDMRRLVTRYGSYLAQIDPPRATDSVTVRPDTAPIAQNPSAPGTPVGPIGNVEDMNKCASGPKLSFNQIKGRHFCQAEVTEQPKQVENQLLQTGGRYLVTIDNESGNLKLNQVLAPQNPKFTVYKENADGSWCALEMPATNPYEGYSDKTNYYAECGTEKVTLKIGNENSSFDLKVGLKDKRLNQCKFETKPRRGKFRGVKTENFVPGLRQDYLNNNPGYNVKRKAMLNSRAASDLYNCMAPNYRTLYEALSVIGTDEECAQSGLRFSVESPEDNEKFSKGNAVRIIRPRIMLNSGVIRVYGDDEKTPVREIEWKMPAGEQYRQVTAAEWLYGIEGRSDFPGLKAQLQDLCRPGANNTPTQGPTKSSTER